MMGPLAVEIETQVKTGTAHVWNDLPLRTRMELMAWVRAQATMEAWENYLGESRG